MRSTQAKERRMGLRWSKIKDLVAATVAVIGLGALALGAPAANAGVLVASATNCDQQVFEQPFLPWADVANYVLSPEGTFEGGAKGWNLSGGASVVSGNESYFVHGPGESH